MQNTKSKNQVRTETQGAGPLVILIGSRTGGPLIPLLGLRDDLLGVAPRLRFGIIGVKGGFEEQVAEAEGLAIDFLPEVKTPGSLRGFLRLAGPLIRALQFAFLALRLLGSTLRAYAILRRTSPALILSMSNFLSVPIIWANRMRGKARARVALHQLDIENKTIRLVRPFVDLLSGGLPEICKNEGSRFFPNPVRYARFDALSPEAARAKLEQAGLLPRGNKRPIALVFGGGSGSKFINDWVAENESRLCRSFFLLHLTGYLQETEYSARSEETLTTREGLTDLMPEALVAADLVIARAGMSTISELLYLKKNAYMVPIPNSHQVANAAAVERFFPTLNQATSAEWMDVLERDVARGFARFQSVNWDYYAGGGREAYRDELLRLAGL